VVLPRGTTLRGADVLVAEDGSLVRVLAAAQPVLQVRHCAEHGSPFDLLRAAYHLGNRHVPLELQASLLQFEPDPVLAEMLRESEGVEDLVRAWIGKQESLSSRFTQLLLDPTWNWNQPSPRSPRRPSATLSFGSTTPSASTSAR
jgi:hypothetical protein